MCTDAKRLANQQNAQHSTGPRTEAGKNRSRYNALKHGLLSTALIINAKNLHESREDYDLLLHSLVEDLQPEGTLEHMEVEKIAVAYWRLGRAVRAEAKATADRNEAVRKNRQWMADSGHLSHDTAAAHDAQLQNATAHDTAAHDEYPLPAPEILIPLIRYESLIDRELHRATTRLLTLQSNRLSRRSGSLEPDLHNPPLHNPDRHPERSRRVTEPRDEFTDRRSGSLEPDLHKPPLHNPDRHPERNRHPERSRRATESTSIGPNEPNGHSEVGPAPICVLDGTNLDATSDCPNKPKPGETHANCTPPNGWGDRPEYPRPDPNEPTDQADNPSLPDTTETPGNRHCEERSDEAISPHPTSPNEPDIRHPERSRRGTEPVPSEPNEPNDPDPSPEELKALAELFAMADIVFVDSPAAPNEPKPPAA